MLWWSLPVALAAYSVPSSKVAEFEARGFARLPAVLTEADIASLEADYDHVMSGILSESMGKDFCDMSKGWGAPMETWSIINGMLPHRYHPKLADTIWTRTAAAIARTVGRSEELVMDYDQLLDKRPGKRDAIFAFHQDMAYWPPQELTNNRTTTVTVTLFLDRADAHNGALQFVPGSHANKTLRAHAPLRGSRDEGHALVTQVAPDEPTELVECDRGDVTVHDEWVVHGSAGNSSPDRRRTYVIAFRHSTIVQAERAAGFTHSHNDNSNWDKWRGGAKGEL